MGANSDVTIVNEAIHSTLTAHPIRMAELTIGNVHPCSLLSHGEATRVAGAARVGSTPSTLDIHGHIILGEPKAETSSRYVEG
jgi:hypothetical protein